MIAATASIPVYFDHALDLIKEIDPDAESMGGPAADCLLVSAKLADRVIAALGDSFFREDPNDPPTEWTRIVVREIRDGDSRHAEASR